MARMDYEDERKKITFRVSADQWHKFDELADNGEIDSKSAAMREKLDELLEEYESDENDAYTPDDEKLSRAYMALVENATEQPDGSLTIPTDAAESLVSQRVSTKKDMVRRLVLCPLEKRGFVKPRWGTIDVKPPEYPPEVGL